MIKRIFALYLLLSVLSLKSTAFSSNGIDDWRLYPSYHNATYCQVAGDKVYILASGALYSYNRSDSEVRLYDKINTLSDIDITHIAYCKEIKALVIVYSNANIDVLYDDEEIYNLSDFKNKLLPQKKINSINIQGSTAYLSTEFGTVEVDLENLEFRNTYNTGLDTKYTYLFKDRLYTATESGLYYCQTSKNMLDKSNWEKAHQNAMKALAELDGKLYCIASDGKLLEIIPETNKLRMVDSSDNYSYIYRDSDSFIAVSASRIVKIDSNGTNKICDLKEKYNFILKDNDTFWCCNGYGGVVESAVEDNAIVAKNRPLLPNSPIRNFCDFMQFASDDKLLVAGGKLNYFDLTFYDGTLMEYDYVNDSWNNLPEDTVKKATGLRYVNMCSIDEDPTEPGHYFASSFGYGIYEFRNGKFVNHYSIHNSPLETVVPSNNRYVRVPMVKFDNEGNLWCINTGVKDIVKILKKDGTWISLHYKPIEYLETMVEPMIDSRGWLWITSLQGEAGVFCAKLNGTPFDTSDDESKVWLNKFTNQDGTSYDIYQVYALTEDHNGKMWVGTNAGLFVIDNPQKFFNDGIFKQIKVPRNDGTGLADYLLSGTYIKSIKVDGANRKWVGTNDNGIYLISADGLETIHHFTTENSPLPSDCIESIAINGKSGEVFIGTDKGMVSYMSDATRAEEKLDENNVYAYPNPVKADYSGVISIVGLTAGCNVKIVDSAGSLMNEGTSQGGKYNWNGRNRRGEKVASGVYYVLTYDSNGDEGVATKILITR
ncbi:MAG: Por secretion system protein [Bacteroidaceae bacterium]|nr:Por secretion system protein [Bacteroidaceae bacterium]